MKEIKFRQPCHITEGGKRRVWYWHKWGIFRDGLRGFESIPALFPAIPEMDIHQEYTGQKINGQEVWEGDILESKGTGDTYTVEYRDYGFFLVKIGARTLYHPLRRLYLNDLKIIGNIIENPELLEAE